MAGQVRHGTAAAAGAAGRLVPERIRRAPCVGGRIRHAGSHKPSYCLLTTWLDPLRALATNLAVPYHERCEASPEALPQARVRHDSHLGLLPLLLSPARAQSASLPRAAKAGGGLFARKS